MRYSLDDFLPTTLKEVKRRGWEELDVILFTGDSYVDHPSFGVAVIGRLLEAEGYRVAIVPQPNWQDDLRDFRKLGKPRLFFGVTAGNMDSMVNHYTAAKRLRSNDAYTAGDKAGFRPDYAVATYTKILKSIFPDTPVVIGGIEASLRRLTHYDYWQDKLLPSILMDSGADILSYGMGDKSMIEIARTFGGGGFNINKLRRLRQVSFVADKRYVESLDSASTITLNSYQACLDSKLSYAENFKIFEQESNKYHQATLVEQFDDNLFVVQNPPYPMLSESELDRSFDLPYTRLPHPKYQKRGAIPAYEMIKYSVNIHRGCFGACSFCTISAHQGKFISSRSKESILREVESICQDEEFRGNLSDLGGPSANMYRMGGKDKSLCERCSRPTCLFPKICPNLDNRHQPLLRLYREVRSMDGIKKVYIGSGIRYDLFDESTRIEYLNEVVKYHTSGRLKVAPEHTQDKVLNTMRKPSFTLFHRLNRDFVEVCKRNNLKYQLIPYFISSHPECRMSDMKELARELKSFHFNLEQVQDFTPTPMTLSTAMFYTGVDPYTLKPVFIERDIRAKRAQKEMFFVKK